MHALGSQYNFKMFSKNTVEDCFFDDVDIVAFPGGIGDSDTFYRLFRNNGPRIRDFVNQGGYYLGICMGAYWAGSHYFDILDGVDAVQYIRRPGTDTRRPHAKGLDVMWKRQPEKMFFYDGCALVGDRKRFKTIATYANGDPMAIVQGNIGLIGCHPESEKFWYDGWSWMKPHWHDRRHHRLLLDFVNQLTK
jgi:glutamine amidotransferase-like uncharacterized protein